MIEHLPIYALHIMKVLDGGYLVKSIYDPKTESEPVFACSSLAEALDYIQHKFEEEHPKDSLTQILSR